MPNVSFHLVRKAAPHIVQLCSFQGPNGRKKLGPFWSSPSPIPFPILPRGKKRAFSSPPSFQGGHFLIEPTWALLELTKFHVINSEQIRAAPSLPSSANLLGFFWSSPCVEVGACPFNWRAWPHNNIEQRRLLTFPESACEPFEPSPNMLCHVKDHLL